MTHHCLTDPEVIEKHCILPPIKKLKVSPFDWFQHAPDDTVVRSASNTPASTKPLSERALKKIRKHETKSLLSHFVNDIVNPVHWWRQYEQTYPLSSDCARRLLVISASSTECERHFSAFNACHVITSQRNVLFRETVETLSIVLKGYKNKLLH